MIEWEQYSGLWRDVLDIGLVSFLIYRLILLVKGTRAASAIFGLILLVMVYFISGELGLYTLGWILQSFLGSLFLVIVILFQRDIRQALSEMGAKSFFRGARPNASSEQITELSDACIFLARHRIGALIVLERNMQLGDMAEKGVKVDAAIGQELLGSIFYPKSPLHDGAVIISKGRIEAARCILPLAQVDKSHTFGTRHRAAIGVTEESDAVVLVVSEERGEVGIAVNGVLTKVTDLSQLKWMLTDAIAH